MIKLSWNAEVSFLGSRQRLSMMSLHGRDNTGVEQRLLINGERETLEKLTLLHFCHKVSRFIKEFSP